MFNLKERLLVLGVPLTVAQATVAEVHKWINSSGPEWTVNRLKSIKSELISRLAENEYRAPWVNRNKSGYPSGPFAWFFKCLESRREGDISVAVNALMIYSSFVSDHETNQQISKFFGSMESNSTQGLSSRAKILPKVSVVKTGKTAFPYFLSSPVSHSKFQMGHDGKSYPESDFVKQYEFALYSEPIRAALLKYPDMAKEVIPYSHFVAVSKRTQQLSTFRDSNPLVRKCVGKISFIQEPGFKLRAVANPSRILQLMLEPLKEAIGARLAELDTDCTFDQGKGVRRVQHWLSLEKTCFSIDLSDATNTFPRTYQIDLIRKTFADSDPSRPIISNCIDVFEMACAAPWAVKINGELTMRHFTRGQPLGLGPSFFMFSYVHNYLLRGICLKHCLPYDFVVLGDDVCIADPEVARIYLATLNNLGCKVSESKTITSNMFAEFGGRIITRNRVIYQNKWRDITGSNFIDVCRQIGPRSIGLLSKRQKDVISAIAEVPSEVGGLGWNPKGKSLEERLSTPIAQMLYTTSGINHRVYESTLSRERKFWNEMSSNGPVHRTDLLDNAALAELGIEGSADQAKSAMTGSDNVKWSLSTKIGQMSMILNKPFPDTVLSDRPVPGYVPVSKQIDPFSSTQASDTLWIMEKKIKEVTRVQVKASSNAGGT